MQDFTVKENYTAKQIRIWQWATRSRKYVPCEACGVVGRIKDMNTTWDGYPGNFYSVHYCHPCWNAWVYG